MSLEAVAVYHVARQVAIGAAVSVATYAVTTAITPGSDFSTGGKNVARVGRAEHDGVLLPVGVHPE